MPNATVRANAQAMPKKRRTAHSANAAAVSPAAATAAEPVMPGAVHSDREVEKALQKIREAEEETARAIKLDSIATKKRDAVSRAEADAAMTAAHAAYDAALEKLKACSPRTSAGARAMVMGLAKIDPPSERWLGEALKRLANSPAFDHQVSEHPDAAIFAAERLLSMLDDEVGRTAWICDKVTAERDGRKITPADETAYDSAQRAYSAALDAMIFTPPKTIAGLRAILKAIVRDSDYARENTTRALARLPDCPALNPPGEIA